VVLLARPAVLLLFALFAAIGVARAGAGDSPLPLARALVVVFGFLLFSVACNDLADEAVDRVNLAASGRPLVAGTGRRGELVATAVTAGAVSLGTAALLGRWVLAVTACGLVLSATYSLRPIRWAGRGAVASMLLPACYVAVPYLAGLLSVRDSVRPADFALLVALYVGFIGRIVLKDFRDVRGDALFGKRTFLVRHGRRATCRLSASCWTAGTALLLVAEGRVSVFAEAQLVCLGVALPMLRALSAGRGARRDEWLVSALAIVGRGMLLLVLAQLLGGSQLLRWFAAIAVTAITVGQALLMLAFGPVPSRHAVPLAGDSVLTGR
jgi:4-hydroxybenzoate polyprenyltransferase